MVFKVCAFLNVSQRRACQVLGQARTTQRHSSHIKGDEERLVARIIELATQYGRYGYRRITALLKQEGWKVNCKMSRENLEKGRPQGAKKATKKRTPLAH
jgi:hypothetical protein